jgi:hypothetical protein
MQRYQGMQPQPFTHHSKAPIRFNNPHPQHLDSNDMQASCQLFTSNGLYTRYWRTGSSTLFLEVNIMYKAPTILYSYPIYTVNTVYVYVYVYPLGAKQ